MKKRSEFAERIAAIHSSGKGPADVRHAELEAMFDTFLGRDFAPAQRKQVEKLQLDLFKRQLKLRAELQAGTISPENYVDSFNQLLEQTFRECENVLGAKNFKQLFGAAPAEQGGFIDKVAFLKNMRPKVQTKAYAIAAQKSRRPQPAFMRPLQPDAKLSAIVGSKPLPRSELTKKLWDYIKKNGLQDKKKKTQINADDSLRAVFNGKSQVSMHEMTKLVTGHIR